MLTATGRDDSAVFFSDLEAGIPMRVLAAPVAVKRIPEFPRFLGYLASLGALSFHAVLPRADIAVWAYYRLLREDPRRRLVASACAGVTSRLRAEGHRALEFLPPVPSPLLCAAIYLRRYRGCGERFAFLSPCALKWTEFDPPGGQGPLVHYNATIRGISAYLERRGIDLSAYPALELEDGGRGVHGGGLTVGAFGGVSAALSRALPGADGRIAMGMGRVLAALAEWLAAGDAERLFEPYACASGCDGGSGVGPCTGCPLASGSGAAEAGTAEFPSREALLSLFERYDRELDPGDFIVA